jgi:hypothetical protein
MIHTFAERIGERRRRERIKIFSLTVLNNE